MLNISDKLSAWRICCSQIDTFLPASLIDLVNYYTEGIKTGTITSSKWAYLIRSITADFVASCVADANLRHGSVFTFMNGLEFVFICVFTVRLHVMQRTALLSEFHPSVCLSVRCVYCDKTKQRTANILIPHERAITLLLWHQQWLVGDAPFPLKSALKVTHPLRKTPTLTDFRS